MHLTFKLESLCGLPGIIDQDISTEIPSEGEDDELRTLVMRLQRHKHMHTYKKNGRRGCRFDYPKILVLKPILKQMQMEEIRLSFM